MDFGAFLTEQNGFPSVWNPLLAILSTFREHGPQNLRYILIKLKIDKVDSQEKIITPTTKGIFIFNCNILWPPIPQFLSLFFLSIFHYMTIYLMWLQSLLNSSNLIKSNLALINFLLHNKEYHGPLEYIYIYI